VVYIVINARQIDIIAECLQERVVIVANKEGTVAQGWSLFVYSGGGSSPLCPAKINEEL